MKMEIFEKARLLGEEIASSDEFKRLQRAQNAYAADTQTQSCLARVDELNEEMSLGSDDFIALKELEQLKAEVASLKEQISSSRALSELKEANYTFNNLMDEVNQVISFVINGEASSVLHGGAVIGQDARQVH